MRKLTEEHLEGVSNRLSQRKTSDLLVQKVGGDGVVVDNDEVKRGVGRLAFCAGAGLVVCLATTSSPTTTPTALSHALRRPARRTSRCREHSATTRPVCEVQRAQEAPASERRIAVMAPPTPRTPRRLNGANSKDDAFTTTRRR